MALYFIIILVLVFFSLHAFGIPHVGFGYITIVRCLAEPEAATLEQEREYLEWTLFSSLPVDGKIWRVNDGDGRL